MWGKGRPEAPFPIFSSRSLALSTAACTCPKYQPSHQQCGQLGRQSSFHRVACPAEPQGRAEWSWDAGAVASSWNKAPVSPCCSLSGPCLLPRGGFVRHHPHSTETGPAGRIRAASCMHLLGKRLELWSLPSSRRGKAGSNTSARTAAPAGPG